MHSERTDFNFPKKRRTNPTERITTLLFEAIWYYQEINLLWSKIYKKNGVVIEKWWLSDSQWRDTIWQFISSFNHFRNILRSIFQFVECCVQMIEHFWIEIMHLNNICHWNTAEKMSKWLTLLETIWSWLVGIRNCTAWSMKL